MVAGHLLDANAEERLGAAVGEEYRCNLARNLADAIDLLPKLVRNVCVCRELPALRTCFYPTLCVVFFI